MSTVITKCFIGAAGASAIETVRKREGCPMFIVSSFMKPMKKCLWCGDFLNANDGKSEN